MYGTIPGLGAQAIPEWNDTVGGGVAGRALGDARHRVRMTIAPPSGRRSATVSTARGVHGGVEQAILGKLINVGRVDGRAIAAELTEADM